MTAEFSMNILSGHTKYWKHEEQHKLYKQCCLYKPFMIQHAGISSWF